MNKGTYAKSVLLMSLMYVSLACADRPDGQENPILILTRTGVQSWQASYDFDKAVDALDFHQPAGDYRQSSWRLPEEFDLSLENGHEVLRRTDDASFRKFSVDITTYDKLWGGHVPFNTFSDGGVSVYTGLFTADAYRGNERLSISPYFEFRPRANEHVIVDGQISAKPFVWQPKNDRVAAFVYFGPATPLVSQDVIAVVDPQTPAWFRTGLESFLPKSFDTFAQQFRDGLPRKATVLVSARFDDGNTGYSWKGGASKEQIQMRLRGLQLQQPNPEFASQQLKFLAHEAAHLWQARAASTGPTAWIHEGGADALALLVVHEHGVWTAADLARAHAEARRSCTRELSATPLSEAGEIGSEPAYYNCGLVIAAATEAAVATYAPDASLFDFWRELITQAESLDRTYTLQAYLAALESMNVSQTFRDQLVHFVTAHHDDPEDAVQKLQAAALTGRPPSDL